MIRLHHRIHLWVFAVLVIPNPCFSAAGEADPHRLTLDECLLQARQNSPRLMAARQAGAAQKVQIDRERPAGIRPRVALTASETFNSPQVPFPNGAGPLVTPNYRPALEMTVSQDLWRFGARRAEVRAGALEKAIALDVKRAEAELTLEVRKAYFNLVTAQRMREVADEAVRLVSEHIRVAKVAVEAGSAMPLEVMRADVELANVRNGLVKADNGVLLARAQLNRLMGRDQDAMIDAIAPEALPADPGPLAEAVARALSERAELIALRETIKALEASIHLAKGQKLPSAAFHGGFAHQKESAFVRAPAWTARIEVTMPLSDHKISSDIREARARYAQMQSELLEAESGIALQTRQAWLNFQEARQRASALPESIRLSRDTLRVAQLRFEVGRATYLEVNDARLAMQRAQADHLQSLSDVHIAAAELERAVGSAAH